ncbi:MAG TPA: hypothetical protein VHZ78_01450 [Rhizomicrobium sp.]|nr:hypothetical protein [Rhizomicrobium sp.]
MTEAVAAAAALAQVWLASNHEPDLRKILILTAGWVLTILGAVITPMPIPIPLIGLLPLTAGLAILINNSRTMRRAIQRIRHRVRWLSYMLEHFAHRLPKKIAQTLHRSHPAPIARKERIATRPPGDAES